VKTLTLKVENDKKVVVETDDWKPKELRFYGDGGTIHDTGDIDVELHNGKVVAVWYRCQALQFTQSEAGPHRAADMQKMYKDYPMPEICGLTLKDKK
jgi:hypothetical protein